MTDKEKFVALITEFGLAPLIGVGRYYDETDITTITFENPQPKVVGYDKPLSIFVFNQNGSFKEVGLWA